MTVLGAVLLLVLSAPDANAAPVPPKLVSTVVPPEALEVPLDVEKATRAYLAQVSGEAREKSDAYFEGGYWLKLWGFLFGSALYLALLFTRISARMRTLAERITSRRWIQPVVYGALFSATTYVLFFPFSLYTDYFREHQYGLSNLSFGGWLAEEGKGFLVSLILGSLALTALYAVLRRTKERSWLWASGVMLAFMVLSIAIAPVLIMPVFNTYHPLKDETVKARILSLGRANQIPVTDVWQNDASKQSDRISANVSGLLGTTRITLNDNLLKRCSLPQVEAVMAHEMGHYVLNHVYKSVLFFALLIPLIFALVQWAFGRLRGLAAARWDIRGVDDPAGLPLLLLLIGSVSFLLTPVLNSFIRTQEQEADAFGVNASQQPDGFAQVSLSLSEYRKLDPGPLEELFFFDHPSGRTRIRTAMRWKAEHLEQLRCAKPPPEPGSGP